MSLPKDYKPGMVMHHPRMTGIELLDAGGRKWARVELHEGQLRSIAIVDDNNGTLATGHAAAVWERKRAKRTPDGRVCVTVSFWVRELGESRTWQLPGDDDERLEIVDGARHVATFVAAADRFTILDDRRAPRIVLSMAEPPPAQAERHRGVVQLEGESILYTLVCDGDAPPGATSEYLMP